MPEEESKANPPDFVKVLPERHLRRVGAQLDQVRAEEHLAVHDLRAVFAERGVHGALETRAAGLEGARRDVELQQLLVDGVDDGWDQCLEVLGARD